MTRLPLRRVLLTAVAVLAILGVATAVYAATRPPSFKLSVLAPKAPTAPGTATAYRIDIERIRGFDGPVRLNLSDLPENVTVAWRLPDGRSIPRHPRRRTGGVLAPGQSRAYAIVFTSRSTQPGLYRPLITAGGGAEVKRRMRKKLRIVAGASASASSTSLLQQALSIVAWPPERQVVQTDSTSFGLAVSRTPGVGAVTLGVRGLPAGATAAFDQDGDRADVTIETTRSTPPGRYDLTFTGQAGDLTSGGAASLVVLRNQPFVVAGDLGAPLVMGQSAPLPLRITNPYDFPLKVTELRVDVSTPAPSCDAAANFAIDQPQLAQALVVPPGTWDVADLTDDAAAAPTVTWRNLDEPQDACLGADLAFAYSGLATR